MDGECRTWSADADAGTLQGWGTSLSPAVASVQAPESAKGPYQPALATLEPEDIDPQKLQALLRDNAGFVEVCQEAVAAALQCHVSEVGCGQLSTVGSFSAALNFVSKQCGIEAIDEEEAEELWDGPMDSGVFYQFSREYFSSLSRALTMDLSLMEASHLTSPRLAPMARAMDAHIAEKGEDASDGIPGLDPKEPEDQRLVKQIFGFCVAGSRFALRNALPKLIALGSMGDLLPRLAYALMRGLERSPRPLVAEAAELLAEAAVNFGQSAAVAQFLLRVLGPPRGPKSKHVRHFCALVLQKLSTRSQEAVFLRLAADKCCSVRLAALPLAAGLGRSLLALVEVAATDPAARLRLAALEQLQHLQAEGELRLDRQLLDVLLGRSMDVSPSVRAQLYGLLAELQPGARRLGPILRRGLEDCSWKVRAQCGALLQSLARAERTPRLLGVKGAESRVDPLLGMSGRLLKDTASELTAEKALRHLLECEECAEQGLEMLVGEKALSREEALLARVAVAMDPEVWSHGALGSSDRLLRQAFGALDAGDDFVLRQILMVLLHTHVRDDVVGKSLLHIATAMLLRAPLANAVTSFPGTSGAMFPASSSTSSTFHLAALLARHALRLKRSERSESDENRFSEAMLTVLDVLQARAASFASSAGPEDHGGLRALAAYAFKEQAALGQEAAAGRASAAFDELEAQMWRILRVSEAFLTFTKADLSEDFPLALLMEDVLRPALAISDIASGAPDQRQRWLPLRALAIRCMALHASLSAASAAAHCRFFSSVLRRCVPELAGSAEPQAAEAAEAIVFHCFAFLVDAQLAFSQESEVWEPVAGLLAGGRRLSSGLRQALALRCCTLLLFKGAEASESSAARWACAWLLLQAFAQVESPEGSQAVEAAVFSSRLLRFFASLRSVSSHHLQVLAAASEGFFSCGLWRLGQLCPLVNELPTVLVLPRLVRFVSRELAQGSATELWVTCLWRPLALVCLGSSAAIAMGDANLPQALLLAVTAASTSEDLGLLASPRAVGYEVAWVINRCVEQWGGWNRSKLRGREGIVAALTEVVGRLAPPMASSPHDWQAVYHQAALAQSRIREQICALGVDLVGFLQDLGFEDDLETAPRGGAKKRRKTRG